MFKVYIRRLKSYNANFLLRISFTVNVAKYLVHYSPWPNKMINVSLKNQACMQDYYNKQFYYA